MAIALSAVPSMWLSYCHGPNHHGGAGHHHNSRLQGGVKWKHNAKHSFGVMRKLVLLDGDWFQNKVCVCVCKPLDTRGIELSKTMCVCSLLST